MMWVIEKLGAIFCFYFLKKDDLRKKKSLQKNLLELSNLFEENSLRLLRASQRRINHIDKLLRISNKYFVNRSFQEDNTLLQTTPSI